MKFISCLVVLFYSASLFAQTPVIANFRQIFGQESAQFAALKTDLIQSDASTGQTFYKSKVEDLPISFSYIQETPGKEAMYIVRYKMADMDGMMLSMFGMIVQQYMTEMNAMVATGNYTGKDTKSGEASTTSLYNDQGTLVVEYISTPEKHTLVFYGDKI